MSSSTDQGGGGEWGGGGGGGLWSGRADTIRDRGGGGGLVITFAAWWRALDTAILHGTLQLSAGVRRTSTSGTFGNDIVQGIVHVTFGGSRIHKYQERSLVFGMCVSVLADFPT